MHYHHGLSLACLTLSPRASLRLSLWLLHQVKPPMSQPDGVRPITPCRSPASSLALLVALALFLRSSSFFLLRLSLLLSLSLFPLFISPPSPVLSVVPSPSSLHRHTYRSLLITISIQVLTNSGNNLSSLNPPFSLAITQLSLSFRLVSFLFISLSLSFSPLSLPLFCFYPSSLPLSFPPSSCSS